MRVTYWQLASREEKETAAAAVWHLQHATEPGMMWIFYQLDRLRNPHIRRLERKQIIFGFKTTCQSEYSPLMSASLCRMQ